MERDDHSLPFFQGLSGPMKSLLVCHATVKRKIFDSYPGPIATALKYSGPFLWLPFSRAHFWTASSSAHLAYRLCAYWGAESIALVGQDLCFHPKTFQSHANVPDYPEWSKPSDVESRIQNQKAFKVPGNNIAEVFTDPTWSLFARDYQVLVNEIKIPTFNTSQLGMKIGNIPYEPLSQWMSNRKFDRHLHLQVPSDNPDKAKDEMALAKKLDLARSSLTELIETLKKSEAQDIIADLYESLPNKPHFLELVLEVVFLDWVKSQNRTLNSDAKEAGPVQRDFLRRSIVAIERVLEILPAKLRL
jgi:hypothetical protein